MGFQSGQVSFGRLAIEPGVTNIIDAEILDKLAAQTLKPTTIGAPPEVESGWCAGAHVFDERFAYDKNVYASGAVAWIAARIDTNRVPSEIKRAIRARETAAALAESTGSFLSKSDKRDVRDAVERAIHEELAGGKHRTSKMVELHWDAPSGTILSASSAGSTIEQLGELWRRTFTGANLRPLGAGAQAEKILAAHTGNRFFDDLEPSAFTPPPTRARSDDDTQDKQTPDIPWTLGTEEPHDYLGNEFLLWLWFHWDTGTKFTAHNDRDNQHEHRTLAEIGVVLDKHVELECAWGVTGKLSLRASPEGPSPFRSPEAFDALATGKLPRKLGLMIADASSQWSLTLQGDRWLVSGCTLPEPPETVELESQRDAAEWRIEQIRRLDELLTVLFGTFCAQRASAAWNTRRDEIRRWIRDHRPHRRPQIAAEPPVLVEPKPAESPVHAGT